MPVQHLKRMYISAARALKRYRREGLVRKVVYKDVREGFGSYEPEPRRITIQKGLPKKPVSFFIPSRKQVLAHELAHARQLPRIIEADRSISRQHRSRTERMAKAEKLVGKLEAEIGPTFHEPRFYMMRHVSGRKR